MASAVHLLLEDAAPRLQEHERLLVPVDQLIAFFLIVRIPPESCLASETRLFNSKEIATKLQHIKQRHNSNIRLDVMLDYGPYGFPPLQMFVLIKKYV